MTSELRQRTKSEPSGRASASEPTTSTADASMNSRPATGSSSNNNNDTETAQQKPGLTWIGRICIFIGFPLCIGLLGLYIAYLERVKDSSKTLEFDRDFLLPFLLALAMAIVVGFQTNGFTSSQVQPVVAWPKVKRVKKVVYKKKKKKQANPNEPDSAAEASQPKEE